MHPNPLVTVLSIWAISLQAGLVTATPIACSELKRDLILKGELPPEACCSYGRCLGDVVVAMF